MISLVLFDFDGRSFGPSYRIQTISPREKRKVQFSMAIGNGELMHEYFPKHSRMGTARTK